MATASAATGSASTQPNDPTGIHRYKLAPPLFDGDYSKYEDWKHKFIAYMALQHSDYTTLLKSSETATTVLIDAYLQASAWLDDEARRWTSMSRDLRYILINICSGSAATVVRQQGVVGDNNGFETFRVLHQRFSIPIGTRSMGYLTTLLKPNFEEQTLEENFLQWEYDIARYELDNGQALPDTSKNCNTTQWDKGSITTALAVTSWTSYNICSNEKHCSRILQSNYNPQQVEDDAQLKHEQLQWSTTNGHWNGML